MSRILVVDDEAGIRQIVKKYAAYDGHGVDEAGDGMQAVELCTQNHYDLVVMDVMMPDLDGFSAVRRIRESSNVPVIMLSARGEEYDRIHGFELGVDDYVVKPFSPRELMMRIAAILARVGPAQVPPADAHEIYESDGFHLDFTARIVCLEGKALQLSPKEYELLSYLVRNRGIALSRDTLLREVWGYDYYGDDRTLDTHIKMLRKALANHSGHIVTLRGMGYRFDG